MEKLPLDEVLIPADSQVVEDPGLGTAWASEGE
jgi:hypothetical protein